MKEALPLCHSAKNEANFKISGKSNKVLYNEIFFNYNLLLTINKEVKICHK
jgi:hypothetical protein